MFDDFDTEIQSDELAYLFAGLCCALLDDDALAEVDEAFHELLSDLQ